jgi:hypothetical protein
MTSAHRSTSAAPLILLVALFGTGAAGQSPADGASQTAARAATYGASQIGGRAATDGASQTAARAATEPQSPVLSPVVVNELKVLEETYVLLDAVAQKAWPGWSGYREIPFFFEFENNLRVLVGHPKPPTPFQLVPGLAIGGQSVAADVSRVTALKLEPFLGAGGGPIYFGVTGDGKPVYTVHISLRGAPPATTKAKATDEEKGKDKEKEAAVPRTEEKVLVYLHELFHCYQRGVIEPKYGNLQFNADAEYATWSQIEGLALERAYRETDAAKARERLTDFVTARALKRTAMTPEQQGEESADDVREGTATYVMLRALEIVKAGGFQPRLRTADDRFYHGFAEAGRMIDEYLERLSESASKHADPKMKCYDYGCFQCALSERYVPGWQKMVEQGTPMDAVLAREFAAGDGERAAVERRLRTDYPYDQIMASARAFTEPRDAAFKQITGRQGRTYIVNLKATRLYTSTLVPDATGSYRLGLLTLYPSGYPGFERDAIQMSPIAVPMNADQLYYLRIVDADWQSRKGPFTITGAKQQDGSYKNAVVVTPLFTLKAPHVRVQERGTRVVIQVLDRVASM